MRDNLINSQGKKFLKENPLLLTMEIIDIISSIE